MNVAGQPMVVLNFRRVAVDLLDRRAGIYSDRPPNHLVRDIMTNGLMFGSAPIGDL
jgi:hypothetical protein